jgi:hypothetical protein
MQLIAASKIKPRPAFMSDFLFQELDSSKTPAFRDIQNPKFLNFKRSKTSLYLSSARFRIIGSDGHHDNFGVIETPD